MGTPNKKKLEYTVKRIPRFILYVLKRVGIRIIPLLTVREDITATGMDPGSFRMGFEGPDRVGEIHEVEPVSECSELIEWFTEGKLCYGVRDGNRLIAKMWCDPDSFHYPLEHRNLEKDEAYLFAACVLDEYRGQNVAGLMRSSCCDELREQGFTGFFSMTSYFNYQARRFKEKLGCRNESLILHVALFGKWSRTWTLKQYG